MFKQHNTFFKGSKQVCRYNSVTLFPTSTIFSYITVSGRGMAGVWLISLNGTRKTCFLSLRKLLCYLNFSYRKAACEMDCNIIRRAPFTPIVTNICLQNEISKSKYISVILSMNHMLDVETTCCS